jgi:hypothetical protein
MLTGQGVYSSGTLLAQTFMSLGESSSQADKIHKSNVTNG